MKKKTLTLLTLVSLFSLVGCNINKDNISNNENSNNNNNNEETQKETPVDKGTIRDEVVHINLSTAGDNDFDIKLKKIARNFEELEPNIKVNVYKLGSYEDIFKVNNKGINSSNDDMILIPESYINELIKSDSIWKLDDMLNKDEYFPEGSFNDFSKSALEVTFNYQRAGKFSLPFSRTTDVLLYNKDILVDKIINGLNNNLPLDESYFKNLTWEELFTNFAPKVKAYLNESSSNLDILDPSSVRILGIKDATLLKTLSYQKGNELVSLNFSDGGAKYNINNNEVKEVIKDIYSNSKAGYLDIASNYKELSSKFKNSKCLLAIDNISNVSSYYDEFKPINVLTSIVPTYKNKERKVITDNIVATFLKKKKADGRYDTNKELASLLFYKYLMSKVNYATLFKTERYLKDLPVINSYYQDENQLELIKDFANRASSSITYSAKAYLSTLDYADSNYLTIYKPDHKNEIDTISSNLISDCLKLDDTSNIGTILESYQNRNNN